MAEKMFMRVNEVAEALDVSEPYAYKLIRKLNEELKQKGCIQRQRLAIWGWRNARRCCSGQRLNISNSPMP